MPVICSYCLGLYCAVLLQEVPRCVLQLLAVGCILLAAKELEVRVATA